MTRKFHKYNRINLSIDNFALFYCPSPPKLPAAPLKAEHQSFPDITYGTLSGGSTMTFFRDSRIDVYQRVSYST